MSFLVAVNETFAACYALGASGFIPIGEPLNKGTPVTVGGCDSGPLIFNTTDAGDGLLVTYASSLLYDASPPQCTIPFDKDTGTLAFGLPTVFGESPSLPVCSCMDSREGYHLTQFTFAALAWR